MPEADAVRRTAARLNKALAGQTLTMFDLRVPQEATTSLVGGQVVTTDVYGKHLLTRITRDDRSWTLHSHLRMDGSWRTGRAGARPVAGPHWQIRAWLQTERAQAVGLRVAMIKVVPTDAEATLIGHLGPDVMADPFDHEQVLANLHRVGRRPLGAALLDQKVVAGLGTIWVSETAWLAGLSPWMAADEADLTTALDEVRRLLFASVAARSRSEQPAPAVYGRAGRPCPRCGNSIRRGRIGTPPQDRQLYFCAGCQSGPAAR